MDSVENNAFSQCIVEYLMIISRVGFRLLRSDFDRNKENHKLQSMWYIHVEGTKAILG